ncbi:MAG: DNA polymerase III subunit delta [Cyanobacteria bacterium Co-bin13]|nr:DNA polymerase III subunit delta [Cyanobacteria bacterium Co-bin13]
MPIHYYWGDDEFRLNQAVTALRDRTLEADWASFNYDRISGEQPDSVIQALNQAMTAPFGLGQRLVWLQETSLGQRCPDNLLQELDRTLPQIPQTTVLLLTSGSKPDGRSKFTKLLQKHGDIREFSTIPPWKSDQLVRQVQDIARDLDLKLAPETADLLAESLGNNTRQLYNELAKLALYWNAPDQPLPPSAVSDLVTVSTQSSLKVATALRDGKTEEALGLVADLLSRNEPALRMVAALVSQFRLWLWIKLLQEAGERNEQTIAKAAEIGNPKRVFFLQKEVRGVSLKRLQQVLPLLLDLEFGLKQGQEEQAALQTKVIEISQLFQQNS